MVQNVGAKFAGPFSIAVYLSDDAEIEPTDSLVAVRSISGLAVGALSSGGGMVTVPSTTAPGMWHVGVVVDEFNEIVEQDETNNSMPSPMQLEVTPAVFPNLRAVSVTIPIDEIDAGDELQVTDTVENVGPIDAGSFVVGIHLSEDEIITSADLLIGVRAIPHLEGGLESTATGPITIPLSTPEGEWFVGTLVDSQGDVEESDEFDNTAVAATQVHITTPPLPDLATDQLSFSPLTVDVGSLFEVSESVTNIGLGTSGTAEVGFYLSADATVTTDDLLIGIRGLSALGIGESSSVSSSFAIPAGTPGGDYHVGAIADHLGIVPELSEENNVFSSLGLVTIVVPPMPDLAMTGFSFTPSVITVGAGGTLSITETVENQGVLNSGTFRIGLYLSTNSAITASDLLIGTRTVTNLAPGQSSTSTTDMPIENSIPGGSWFVGALADDLDAIAETSAGNNAIFSGNTLDVVSSPDPMPDLEMKDLTFSPHSAVAGSTLSFQDLVRNVGTLSSGAFHVGVFLSTDEEVTSSDLMLAERIVFNLAIDFGSASSFQAILPSDLAEGDYFIGAIADNHMVVSEGDEENNMFRTIAGLKIFVPPPPMPDLVLTELTFTPDTAEPGDALSISDTLRNSGNLETSVTFQVSFYASDDDEITTSDTLLGTRSISGLDSAADSSGTTQITLPSDLGLGTWRVGALIDRANLVDESNEENNTRTANGQLEIE